MEYQESIYQYRLARCVDFMVRMMEKYGIDEIVKEERDESSLSFDDFDDSEERA